MNVINIMSVSLKKAKKLPLKPGVYMFVSRKGGVLYIGRATSLKRRIMAYFQGNLDLRLKEMAEAAQSIKYYKTDNLLEAVILEANLIKKYWPKYNIREKDDRSFIYIIIPKTEYPQPLIVRATELRKFPVSKSNIFGPYQSLSLVKNFLRIIRRILPYSTCVNNNQIRDYSGYSDAFVISDRVIQGRPCFDHQIGLCPGLCIGAISKNDYQKNIDNIILLLSGKKKNLIKKLEKENPDKVKFLKHIQDVSLIFREESVSTNFYRIEGYDISHLTGKETYGAMVVFINNAADKNEYRLFKIKEAPQNDDLRALAEMISRRFRHSEWRLPNLILIDGGKPQVNFVFKFLKERNVGIPIVGVSKYKSAHPEPSRRARPGPAEGDRLVFGPKMKKIPEKINRNK